jgi:hypothetical protein
LWDILHNELDRDSCFKFNPNNTKWHLFGESILEMAIDNKMVDDYWRNMTKSAYKTWPNDTIELKRLFKWINCGYWYPGVDRKLIRIRFEPYEE